MHTQKERKANNTTENMGSKNVQFFQIQSSRVVDSSGDDLNAVSVQGHLKVQIWVQESKNPFIYTWSAK